MKLSLILTTAALVVSSAFAIPVQAADAPVHLTWQMWANTDQDIATWKHLAAMVTEDHPEITVELVPSAWPDYWTKLPILAASGQLADIVSMQSLRMPAYYGMFEPLNARVAADGFDLNAFAPSVIGGMSVQGQLYGLPYDVGPMVVYYNKDAFDAAGLKEPAVDWTIDEFKADAKALTKDGQYGFDLVPMYITTFAKAMGVNYLDASGKPDFTNPAFVALTKLYTGLVTDDKVSPLVATGSASAYSFLSGNIAMTLDGPWDVGYYNANVKFKVGMAPMPHGTGLSQSVTAGSGFGIAASSKNKDAAWKAIQTITGPRALKYLAEQGRALAARTAEQDAWYDVAANGTIGARKTLEYAISHSTVWDTTANWNLVEGLWGQYLPLVLTGKQTVEQTLATIQSLATQ